MSYSIGETLIDDRAYEVWHAGQRVSVEPQVLELLLFLVRQRDRVVSKEEIIEHVWHGRVVSESAISSRIKAIRKLLGDDGSRQEAVRTIYGRGFRFVGQVSETSDAVAASNPSSPVTSLEWEPPLTRYVAVGDVHVAYQVFGSGPVDVVIAPGFISNVEITWDNPEYTAWLRAIAEYARVVVFDKRGTGLSDRVRRLPAMDERMEDVTAVMDAAGMESANLLGISEGGALAALFAASHPSRCQSLVLFGSFARPRDPSAENVERFTRYVRSHWGTGKSLANYAPSQVGNRQFERWWGRFERLGASHASVVDLVKMNSQIDIVDVLPTIRVPTLVVHRAGDVLINISQGRLLSEKIPGARLLSPEGADHIPWVGDSVSEELREIRRFLELHASGGLEEESHVLATVVMVDCRAGQAEARRDPTVQLARLAQRESGSPIQEMGGCTLCTFDAPGRALRFARSVQTQLPEAQVGVHTGEVRMNAQGVDGFAVSLASDIARRAEPGQILASRTVTDLVVGSGIQFTDLGPHALDGLPEDWHLYRVD